MSKYVVLCVLRAHGSGSTTRNLRCTDRVCSCCTLSDNETTCASSAHVKRTNHPGQILIQIDTCRQTGIVVPVTDKFCVKTNHCKCAQFKHRHKWQTSTDPARSSDQCSCRQHVSNTQITITVFGFLCFIDFFGFLCFLNKTLCTNPCAE